MGLCLTLSSEGKGATVQFRGKEGKSIHEAVVKARCRYRVGHHILGDKGFGDEVRAGHSVAAGG